MPKHFIEHYKEGLKSTFKNFQSHLSLFCQIGMWPLKKETKKEWQFTSSHHPSKPQTISQDAAVPTNQFQADTEIRFTCRRLLSRPEYFLQEIDLKKSLNLFSSLPLFLPVALIMQVAL